MKKLTVEDVRNLELHLETLHPDLNLMSSYDSSNDWTYILKGKWSGTENYVWLLDFYRGRFEMETNDARISTTMEAWTKANGFRLIL